MATRKPCGGRCWYTVMPVLIVFPLCAIWKSYKTINHPRGGPRIFFLSPSQSARRFPGAAAAAALPRLHGFSFRFIALSRYRFSIKKNKRNLLTRNARKIFRVAREPRRVTRSAVGKRLVFLFFFVLKGSRDID